MSDKGEKRMENREQRKGDKRYVENRQNKQIDGMVIRDMKQR
jgi:hypothetical protein